jgi:hypothetical protein
MATILSSAELGEYPDEALEGERCRNCGRAFNAGDPVILAVVPAGYEAAYCSAACLQADRKGGDE